MNMTMAQMVSNKEVNPLVSKQIDKFKTPKVERPVDVHQDATVSGFYTNEHTYGGKITPIRCYQSNGVS